MKTYSNGFYANRHEETVHAANTILSILLQRLTAVHSAVDIGCGVGTWLAALQEKGVKDIQGVDGDWVNQDLLAIPRTAFKQVDLSKSAIKLPRKYDLAISLEVAEHLPPNRAKEFVSSLTALADHVLFSAAIPFQGGVHHVNEQWQTYWVELFRAAGYDVHDFIRSRIWNDSRIPFWYRQNILLFSKAEKTLLEPIDSDASPMPLDLVHPDLYLKRAQAHSGAGRRPGRFRGSVTNYLSRKLRMGK
jgi:cyclopropane fatty-acyl-phospholipid synthase-like methyltransferase